MPFLGGGGGGGWGGAVSLVGLQNNLVGVVCFQTKLS